jgi:hypothetical protein
MALPISIPYTFANATTSIPLSQLDSDFSIVYAAVNGIGNGTVALPNVSISGGNGTFTTITSPASTNLTIQSSSVTAMTIDTNQNVTATGTVAMGSSFKRNRIINGNMLIDQRNAGANVTINTTVPFISDRWTGYSDLANMTGQRTQATTPVGFTYVLGVTVGTGATPSAGKISRLEQRIEGDNFADLFWGGANALPITLSFWVRSSVTGTHSGSLVNSAGTRSYPFTFTISSANTWEYKTISVTGDLTGTWLTDNSTGCKVIFNLGTGSTYLGTAGAWAAAKYFGATGSVQLAATTGATFYITGVQLEVGTKATPYEMQIYSDQLAQCQRYLYIPAVVPGGFNGSGTFACTTFCPVSLRAIPTISYSGTVTCTAYGIGSYTSTTQPSSIGLNGTSQTVVTFSITGLGATVVSGYGPASGVNFLISAEL